ncbi:hydroxyacylglutathione hydrolase [Pelomonas sp. SE-A7]|uniref:hydroxyacylglutathione hydrolase n=1 Tax=Pelomonas sp. SE-A7 TaxID=3054953 RepID=UPI00259C75B4|nr:hydroxyacylglutathione hydrolase [Pelomonas sp. SE-A7]MDM4765935.1 hydroxyacylglutathione hydrolase [Pelomonas sp. SE-A7]
MKLVALPAFSDNYIWMLHDGSRALVVDPGEAAPVQAALTRAGLKLAGILVTHHHADHVGGLADLRSQFDGPVIGPAAEQIAGIDLEVAEGDQVEMLDQRFEVLDVPGHTAGHIAFLLREPSDGSAPILFCGDTLFSGGCGRLFEGTPAQMVQSLDRLIALPAETRVCCAHEYTLSNLRFAQAVEPGNADLAAYVDWCQAQRAKSLPTLPSSIGTERRINPFLRCTEPEVRASALQQQPPLADDADRVAVFATLRQWKNEFR